MKIIITVTVRAQHEEKRIILQFYLEKVLTEACKVKLFLKH